MEKLLLQNLDRLLDPQSQSFSPLRALPAARSLATNPSSSAATRAAVVAALLRHFNNQPDPWALKVLAEISSIDSSSLAAILDSIKPLLSSENKLSANALAVLESIVDCESISSLLDGNLIVSLAASSKISVRSHVINVIVSSFGGETGCVAIEPPLVVQLLLGLSGDLYPLIRQYAVNGLVKFTRECRHLVERVMVDVCYERAVELLRDDDDLVRAAAIQLVSECGQIFEFSEQGIDNSEIMDVVFLQLCSMARDMSMQVRLEAFIALGKVRYVSENMLLQSLSKKLLRVSTGGKALTDFSTKIFAYPISSAAGAFVHGIEDEYYQVRTAACKSLGMLTLYSLQFAATALNLLMNMLNDDAVAVRLQTLQDLFYMATHDSLKIQEKHMDMFLGLLADVDVRIRKAARKVLQLMRLPDQKILKSSIDSLLTNLETHPEEEDDIFRTLFFIGQHHGTNAAKLCKKLFPEMTPFQPGQLYLDHPRVAAFSVLVISLPFSKEVTCELPPQGFSYSLILLGRISRAFRVFINAEDLLAYLLQHNGLLLSPALLNGKDSELSTDVTKDVIAKHGDYADQLCRSSWPVVKETIHTEENLFDLDKKLAVMEKQPKWDYVDRMDEEMMLSINLVLKEAAEVWPLMQPYCAVDVQTKLRSCKEELDMICWSADASVRAVLDFALEYILSMQLLTAIFSNVRPSSVSTINAVEDVMLLEKLETCLKRMMYCFLGMSNKEKNHVLELMLLAHLIRLSTGGLCLQIMLKKLHDMVLLSEYLLGEGITSDFVNELKKLCTEQISGKSSQPFPVSHLLGKFQLQQIQLTRKFRHIKADIQVPRNDSENPLLFIPGLPVCIRFNVELWNTFELDRLWFRMAVGNSVQYVHMGLNHSYVCNEVRRFDVEVPFYVASTAASFILKGSIVMECVNLDIPKLMKNQKEPEHDIILLSEEIDVYLVNT